jgi:hypothetical protein
MTDWHIIVVVLIISVLGWAVVERWLLSAIGFRRLRNSARSVSTDQAIAEHESGLGNIFRNSSLLPGEWWLLRTTDRRDDYDLVANLEKFGYVIDCRSSADRKRIKFYVGKVEDVLEPFD